MEPLFESQPQVEPLSRLLLPPMIATEQLSALLFATMVFVSVGARPPMPAPLTSAQLSAIVTLSIVMRPAFQIAPPLPLVVFIGSTLGAELPVNVTLVSVTV